MKKVLFTILLLPFLNLASSSAQQSQYDQLLTWHNAPALSEADKKPLFELLQNKDPLLRQSALEVLLEHQVEDSSLIPVLTNLVKNDSSTLVRGLSATVLVQQGSPAFSEIQELLIGPDLRVRQTMATAVRGSAIIPEELKNQVEWASPPHALNGPTLHPNSSFEAGILGWKFSQQDNATGKYEIDEQFSRDGKKSLKLTKTNGLGYLRLKSTFPIVVPPGKTELTWRGWFRAQNAPLSSVLTFRLTEEDGKTTADSIPTNSARWQSQTMLRNTPDHTWEKRLFMVKPSDKERRYYMEVILYGNPGTVWLDELDFPAQPWNFYVSDPIPSFPVQKDSSKAIQQPTEIKVLSQNNKTEFLLDGKAVPPIWHFPFVPERGNYAIFDKAGIPLQTVLLELTDTDRQLHTGSLQSPSWPTAKEETYNFTSLLKRVERAAQQMPESKIMLGFHVMWPRDYVATFPETAWHNHRGEKAYGSWLFMSGFSKELPSAQSNWWPSQYQDKPFEDAAKVIYAFMQELKKTPYANQVSAAFISGGQDGQFYIKDRDYSEAGTEAWKKWLKEKYQTLAALNQSWKTTHSSFEEIKVPQERQAHQISKTQSPSFFDPATETNQRDYEEFRTQRMWRIKEILLKAADEGIGRDLMGISWNMGGALNGVKTLLHSKYLDGLIIQPSYEHRMPGYVGGNSAAYQSFAKHGKLLIKEMDTRSWLRETYNNEIQSMKISTPMNADWFKNLFRKETGQIIAEDQGWWHFDISHNAFNHPEILKEIQLEKKVYDQTVSQPREFKPEVALIYSHDGYPWARTTHYGFRKSSIWFSGYQEKSFATAGIAADKYFVDDFMQLENWDQYKTIVFVNTYFLSPQEREFINKNLKNNNRTLIWHYAAGYQSRDKMSTDNISELTGMRVATELQAARQRAIAVESDHELASNLQPLQGMADIFRAHFRIDEEVGTFDAQRFWIEDDSATTLAQYPDDQKTAIAVKDFENWRSIYVAPLAGLSSELLHNAASLSNAYVTTEPSKVLLNMNDRFISLHALQTGKYQIHLPKAKNVIDVDTQEVLFSQSNTFEIDLEAQETRWLLLSE